MTTYFLMTLFFSLLNNIHCSYILASVKLYMQKEPKYTFIRQVLAYYVGKLKQRSFMFTFSYSKLVVSFNFFKNNENNASRFLRIQKKWLVIYFPILNN